MVLKQKISLEEFLELPESEPALEFIDGEVVEKEVPKIKHATLQLHLAARLLESTLVAAFKVFTEARFIFGSSQRVYIPDVSVVARERLVRDELGEFADDQFIAPDIAIEILSPGQSAGRLLEKLTYYLENGVRLALVVDVEEKQVSVYRPAEQPRLIASPGFIDFEPVIQGLRLDLNELFDKLK
jgi:Uma2 family endonuclease